MEIIFSLIFGLIFPVPEASLQSKDTITEDDKTPIVVVIPGLTSDSAHAVSFLSTFKFFNPRFAIFTSGQSVQNVSQYVKHCAFKMAKCGWNVVVSNHRGLGGISITVSTRLMRLWILFF